MAIKKDVWITSYVQVNNIVDSPDIHVVCSRIGGIVDFNTVHRNKRSAITTAVNTARILYYNTVIGTSIPLPTNCYFSTYRPSGVGRIDITSTKKVPETLILMDGSQVTALVNRYIRDDALSKKAAELLLDKITTRYAKYIEYEDYWQDLFKLQAEMAPTMERDNADYNEV